MGSAVSRQLEAERSKPKRPATPPDLRQRLKSIPYENSYTVDNVQSANSNSNIITVVVDLEPPAKLPPNRDDKEKFRTILCYHTSDEEVAKSIADELKRNQKAEIGNLLMVNECNSLEYIGASMLWSNVVILIISYKFQQNLQCQEITNYAKDTQKNVVTVVVQPNYDPSGVVGAVGKAYGEIVWRSKGDTTTTIVEKIFAFPTPANSRVDVEVAPKQEEPTLDLKNKRQIGDENTVYISYADGSEKVADIVKNGQRKNNKADWMFTTVQMQTNSMKDFVVLTAPSKDAIYEDGIRKCRVFVPIISKAYETSSVCRGEFELARTYGKNIVPVKAEKFSPSGWLALAMSGKLFYEIKDEKDAYDANPKFPDTNRMNEFIGSVIVNMKSVVDENMRENKMKELLEKEINEIKPKLKEWPPKSGTVNTEQQEPPPDKESLLPQKQNNSRFVIQSYEITRLAFPPLYNELGQPIEHTFDCMISYQWGIQSFIEQISRALKSRNVEIWLDMLGGMVGNINDAMARAVEASVCVAVFLTNSYQTSTNCLFELKYALALKRPIIFILAQNNLEPLPWIKPLLDKHLVFTIRNVQDFETPIKGWPTIVVFADAIRKIAEWKLKQRKPLPSDVSEDVYRLQIQLEQAKTALAEQQGQSLWNVCTRCHGKFEESNKSGCKKHTAYYMNGVVSVIAGRWVCCQQTDINSLGCTSADHTTEKRNFVDPNRNGCRQWIPA